MDKTYVIIPNIQWGYMKLRTKILHIFEQCEENGSLRNVKWYISPSTSCFFSKGYEASVHFLTVLALAYLDKVK